jgi:hypothetical protein
MKKTILILLLCALCFGASYSTQTTSNFSVRWTFTGADAAAVDDAEIRYLASAVMGSGADADIFQRDANGAIELDNVGRKKIQKSKVRPAFRAIVAAKVQEWAEQGDIGELSSIQVQAVTRQVREQAKPVVQ